MELRCPHCGRINDRHQRAPGEVPVPDDNDVSVCWRCGGLALFATVLGKVGLRLPTPEEQSALDAEPELAAVRAAIRKAQRPTDAVELLRRTGVYK